MTETYVKVFGQNRAGEILLLRRSPSARSDAGLLDLPGGKVEAGENLSQALSREVREETGLNLENLTELFRQNIPHPHEKKPITVVWYTCKFANTGVLLNSENSEYQWVRPSNILKLLRRTMYFVHRPAVEKYLSLQL